LQTGTERVIHWWLPGTSRCVEVLAGGLPRMCAP